MGAPSRLTQPALAGGAAQALAAYSPSGRLQRDSATQISYQRWMGDTIEVNGEYVQIGAAGLTRTAAGNLITAAGADAGAAMAVSTLYYVYISNSAASFSPSTIRASATAPTRGTTAGTTRTGVYYLADSGNGANWRFLGWVRTDATGPNGNFVDTTTDRLVVNYYNRLSLSILLQPGYVDDNVATSYTSASTTWTAANGGTGATGSYIANGEDAEVFELIGSGTAAAGLSAFCGIGNNVTTTAYGETANAGNDSFRALAARLAVIQAVGYYTVSLLVRVSAGTATFYADDSRGGGTTDPRLTYLSGIIRG